MNSREKTVELLGKAGLVLNGPNPTDPQVKDERVFDRILSSGSLGAGESYMDGWWEVEDLSGFFTKLLLAELHVYFQHIGALVVHPAGSYVLNLQSKAPRLCGGRTTL
jgi:cyclopropane-fatty-acyl-phospholipid synthase